MIDLTKPIIGAVKFHLIIYSVIRENTALYRKRQELNEHIFGTIKRKWGFHHTNLVGLKKVNGEFAFIMLVYNIKRTLHILRFDDLMTKLKNSTPDYRKMVRLLAKTTFIVFITRIIFSRRGIRRLKLAIA